MNISPDIAIRRIAFSQLKGMNIAVATEMLQRVSTLERFFDMSEPELQAATGVASPIYTKEYRQTALDKAAKEYSFATSNRIRTLWFQDSDFPMRLAQCNDAPTLLYTLGNFDLNQAKVLSIVGTRNATVLGIDFTRHLVADLADAVDNLVIVSGLAYGIDVSAHKAALDAGIPTVAVMAHGLNTLYPADHRSVAAKMIGTNGGLLTEYTSTDTTHRGTFLQRNRIVAGLADAVLVVESDLRGGSMSTAHIASAYNREVLAMPGRVNDIYSRGCNKLIARQMAHLVRDADDIIDILGWTRREKSGTQKELPLLLSPEQEAILEHIRLHPAHTVNEMCTQLNLTFSALADILFQLEMQDVIISVPGGRYALVAH